MAIRYVKDFEFPSAAGFTSSAPSKVTGPMFAKGGKVEKEPKGMMVIIGVGKPKGPMRKAEGGKVKKFDDGGMYGEGVTGPYDINNMPQPPSNVGKGAIEGGRLGGINDRQRRMMMMQASKRQAEIAKQAQNQGMMSDMDLRMMERGYKKGGDVESISVKDIKSGKVKQSTDEDFYGKAKDMPMPTRRPAGMKKGGMAQKVQMAKSNAIESSLKGQKKTGYVEGGKAVKVPLPNEDEAPYPSQWPMPSDEQINKENWNQRKAIRRAMGAKNTGKDTFAKGGYAEGGMKAEQGVPLPSPEKESFEVYDRQTGDVVGTYGSLKRASRAVDRRDNEYGGYRYGHRPVAKAKGGMAHEDVAADKSLIKSMVKPAALKKADGGGIPPQMRAALARRANSVPVAPRAPMIPQQAMPARGALASIGEGGIGVGQSRPNKPNVGAIRAAMAKKASMAMPENAPSMMKKGGKVKC
jgi:hypothetical protein